MDILRPQGLFCQSCAAKEKFEIKQVLTLPHRRSHDFSSRQGLIFVFGLLKLNCKLMAEEKCKKCGMPLEKEEDRCSCEESTCYHCCECPSDCSCGCKGRE